jgi:type III secretory pathway component EscU
VTPLLIEAPTDAQLDVIRAMCRERCVPLPDVIYSKAEARRIFDELKAGTYDPERYRLDADLPEALRR